MTSEAAKALAFHGRASLSMVSGAANGHRASLLPTSKYIHRSKLQRQAVNAFSIESSQA
jgi:hypothetical protein